MNSTPFGLTVPTTEVELNGRVWKVTRLKTAHGNAANKWASRIKGGSSRVRCASSNGVTNATCNTALGDVGAVSGSRKVYIA
tara:strand:+ start:318 stop:563 length:246 start_codon:yes stop_codon:yes gene_type:complete